jgi:hypothetical protein
MTNALAQNVLRATFWLIDTAAPSKAMEGMVEQIGSSFFAGSTRWMAPELI